MFWLVDAYFAAAGKGEGRKFSPTLFVHLRDLHILRSEIFQGRRDVVAHKVKLVLIVLLGIMERGFEWRHGEDQPSVARINRGKLKHITKESPVSFRILGVDNDMCAVDQVKCDFRMVTAIFSWCGQVSNRTFVRMSTCFRVWGLPACPQRSGRRSISAASRWISPSRKVRSPLHRIQGDGNGPLELHPENPAGEVASRVLHAPAALI